jgi:hypothetical protein
MSNKYEGVLTKEFLWQHYVLEKKGSKTIGRLVGCSDMTITRYLRLNGIEVRKQGWDVLELTGNKYGLLTPLKKVGRANERVRACRWQCKCECGNLCVVSSNLLRRSRDGTASCGCLKRRKGSQCPTWKGGKYVPKQYWTRLHAGAKYRRLEVSISLENAEILLEQQHFRCALSGLPIAFPNGDRTSGWTASLDRIDSSIGYIPTNVQWVHKDINRMKQNFPESYFFQLCGLILAKRK